MTRLKCTVVTNEEQNWFVPFARHLVEQLKRVTDASLVFSHCAVYPSDIVFYLSYHSIVSDDVLALSGNNVVVHESNLPKGRGWAPLTWQVLEGHDQITLTLFEATTRVDAGPIYLQEQLSFNGTELIDEMRELVGALTISMCQNFVDNYPQVVQSATQQTGESTYYSRRIPSDSRLDPEKTITEQFNLLRVVDNECYPAFFELYGRRYLLTIEACDE